LARVSAFCDTYLFTSATSDYARPVIELLDPLGSVFKGIYTREFTTKTDFISGPVHVKDLTTIMRTPDFSKNLPQMSMAQLLARVVLVDNNPLSFIPQPSNGILVENFYHSISDCALSRVWETLSQLQSEPDVRTRLRPMFRMAETLASLQQQQQQQQQHEQQQQQQQQQREEEVQMVQQQVAAACRPSTTTPPPACTGTANTQLEGELLAAIEMEDFERQRSGGLEYRAVPPTVPVNLRAVTPTHLNGNATTTGKRKLSR